MKVIKFEAEWCGPCQAMKPVWQKFTEQESGIEFEVVDVDDDPSTASQYSVRSIPTIVFLKDGQVVQTLVGMQNLEKLTAAVAKLKGE